MDSNVGSIDNDAITAASIAANAIGASELAADAVSEIQSGLSTLDAAGVRSAVGLAAANLDTQLDAIPTAGENADAIWDEALAGHVGAGSTGEALDNAASAGDPWGTALPGAYGAGTAGKIVGDNLNATVSSRSTLDAAGVRTAVGLASANLDTQLGDIQADTDNIQTRIPAALIGGRMDANVEAINNDAGGPDRMDRSARTMVLGTVGNGATTTSIPTSSLAPAAVDVDQFRGRAIVFDKDTATTGLRGQGRTITGSAADGTLTVNALTTAPANGDTFVIV
jgi:hypothetical protein